MRFHFGPCNSFVSFLFLIRFSSFGITTSYVLNRKNLSERNNQKAKQSTKEMSDKLAKPLSVLHQFMTQNSRVCIWLEGDNNTRLDGVLSGFDEFMNLVLEDAAEVNVKSNKRLQLGKMLLKGDNIALIHSVA